jgi:nucleotide-binding universal stress UspA family protein
MGKIVVGVDGSAGSGAALAWAIEEARLRGSTLHAVHAWELALAPGEPETYVAVGEPSSEHDLEAVSRRLETSADEVLAASVRDVDATGVDLRPESVEGNAADTLLHAAEDAELLVVGSRGRGTVKSLVLGSVSQKVAHRAGCPVVIVRAHGS